MASVRYAPPAATVTERSCISVLQTQRLSHASTLRVTVCVTMGSRRPGGELIIRNIIAKSALRIYCVQEITFPHRSVPPLVISDGNDASYGDSFSLYGGKSKI